MKRPSFTGLSAFFLAVFLGQQIPAASAADVVATWTNGRGNGLWEVDYNYGATPAPGDDLPGNWSSGAFPQNGRSILNSQGEPVPGLAPSYAVNIFLPAACTLASSRTVNTLTLGSGARLRLSPLASLDVAAGTLVNNGEILLNPTGSADATSLILGSSGTGNLSGNGVLKLAGPQSRLLVPAGATLSHATGHQILGSGIVDTRNAALLNSGLIHADVTGSKLSVLAAGALPGTNTGAFQASNLAILHLEGGRYVQGSLGLVFADFGTIELSDNVTFVGGTLSSLNDGRFNVTSATLEGCLNISTYRIFTEGGTVIKGTGLENIGLIEVNATFNAPTNKTTTLLFDTDGAITGAGRILLNGIGYPGANLTVADNRVLNHTASHTIYGLGNIIATAATVQNGGMIVADKVGGHLTIFLSNNAANNNTGMLHATNAGTLIMAGGTLNQATDPNNIGRLLADDQGIVEVGAPGAAATLIGGILAAGDGGVIRLVSAVLVGDIELQGGLKIGAAGLARVTGPSVLNRGTLTLEAASAEARFESDATINGAGEIRLTNNALVRILPAKTVTIGADQLLAGNGTLQIEGALVANGTLEPGVDGPGKLSVAGALSLGATSRVDIEIGGTTAGAQFDVIAKSGGALALNGTLSVRLINGFAPAADDSFAVLTSGSALGGEFSNVPSGGRFSTADGAGSFQVDYGAGAPASGSVVLSHFVAGPILSSPLNVSLAPGAGGSVSAAYLGTSTRKVGQAYTIVAKPSAGYVFNGWTGSLQSQSAALGFVMAPNFKLTANFVADPFAPILGKFSGFGTRARVNGTDNGALDLTLAKSGSFSAKFTIAGVQLPFKGQFLGSGHYVAEFMVGKRAVSVDLMAALGGTDELTGTIVVDGKTFEIQADRLVYSKSAAAPQAGAYTVAFPPNAINPIATAPRPQGNGWAKVKVSSAGAVTLAGALADGTKISRSGFLSKHGEFVLYASLYKGGGQFGGVLTFAAPPRAALASDVTGAFAWAKPSEAANKVLPKAFDTTLEAIGSFYTAPAPGSTVLPGLNAQGRVEMALLGGNVFRDGIKQLAISSANKVTYLAPLSAQDTVSLVFNTPTGAFTGSFFHPRTEKKASFSGVILQKQKSGRGFYPGVDSTGTVRLTPLP